MLKKIIYVKNVGRFRNSAAAGNPQLAKHTFIIGANGYGKTTLCAVLRSIQSGDASHVLGRKTLGVAEAPAIELLVNATPHRFDGAAWSAPHPAIAIFDGVFVAENVHSGDTVEIDHKRNLFRVIIGEDGVKFAEEDAILAADTRTKIAELATAARAIQPHVPAGMRLEAFIALAADAGIDASIAAQEQTVAGIREAGAIKARAALSEIPVLTMPAGFADLLLRTIDDIAADSEKLLADHLAAHGMAEGGGTWIAAGMKHTDRDTCPFCGQNIKGLSLITAFRAVFSDRYNALKADIGAMRAPIANIFGDAALARLDTLAEQNRSGIEFWSRYCRFEAGPLAFPPDISVAARGLGAAALALLDRKAQAPLEAVPLDDAFIAARTGHATAQDSVNTVNGAIRAVNALIAAKKAETGAADLGAAETELARRRAVRTRHIPEVAALCDEHTRLVTAKAGIEKRKEEVRDWLEQHTRAVVKPYERRINELLAAFNAGFAITETKHSYPGGVATSSYQLVINQTAIDVGDGKTPTNRPSFKNTLSAGDRTTLAMAFFLAHLERDAMLAQRIVVFDDPFNSQDAFRRRQTVHEIMKMAGRCAQVIVLSHDATFLKQLWDKAPAAERISLGITDLRSQGSKIMPVDLEKACQGRTASDIDDLQTYLTTGAGVLVDIIRKMRGVLETFCRTTYPASFMAEDWLGDIVRKIREGGDAHPAHALYDELDQINDYTKQYHHGEDVADATPDQIDPTELTGFAKRTLRIVNALQA